MSKSFLKKEKDLSKICRFSAYLSLRIALGDAKEVPNECI